MQSFLHTHRHELRVLGACVGLLAVLALAVVRIGVVGHLDLRAIQDVHAATLPPVTGFVFAVTAIGNTQVILLLSGVAVLALVLLRQWRDAGCLALSAGLTQLVVAVAKHVVERPRPPSQDALTHAAGFSFPSGHAASTAALFGLLLVLALRRLEGPARVVAAVTCICIVLAVGLSRVYLGVHYPTDVMAGWLVGGVLALTPWLVAALLWRRRGASGPAAV